ncbi:MAG: hypothetical protein B6I31_03985 [Desulfobacteraceae bacterium 4572_19]|nr:MAG: hypothetical protein B6I31_03985 [Desulfobacteraceae bacterium 4572_19]
MKMEKIFKKVLFWGFVALLGMGISTTSISAKSKPTLNLFPNDVAEHLAQTGAIAKSMEEGLKDVIMKLEGQSRLYNETGCDGSSDPGCAQIATQMGDNYMEMLSIMRQSLPEMKHLGSRMMILHCLICKIVMFQEVLLAPLK